MAQIIFLPIKKRDQTLASLKMKNLVKLSIKTKNNLSKKKTVMMKDVDK